MTNTPQKVIVHHSGVSSSSPQLYAINRYHANHPDLGPFPKSVLGWYVGYHWIIERDGTKTKTRDDYEDGVHTIGWNNKSIAICLAGNFDIEAPTVQQLATLRDLIGAYKLPYSFHRENQEGRTCPGRYLTREAIDQQATPLTEIKKKENLERQVSLLKQVLDLLRKLLFLDKN